MMLAGQASRARAELERIAHEGIHAEWVAQRKYLVDQPYEQVVARFRAREATLVEAFEDRDILANLAVRISPARRRNRAGPRPVTAGGRRR